MDFSNADIPKILKSGMTNKFMDFSPQDFEDFISQLFRDNGYKVEQTKYSGDYGVDIIIKKEDEHIAVQVKRYKKDNKVGVKDVNQVLGGRDYYKCNDTMIITTSSFTNQVKKLAEKTAVDLWDWNKLQKYISDTYLDGKDYHEYFKEKSITKNASEDFSFDIFKIIYNQPMKGNFLGTQIFVSIQNHTDQNHNVSIELPTYITSDNNQIEARNYLTGYFISGKIYSGCVVESCFVFDSDQLPHIKVGDKLILKVIYSSKTITKVINIEHRIPSKNVKSGCFIATATYGTPFSKEIQILRDWRDKKLKNYWAGRWFIDLYYFLSPPIANFIRDKPLLRKVVRIMLNPFVDFLKRRYNKSTYE